MLNTTITNVRKDIYNILEQTVKYNEPVHVTIKNGNAVLLSEEEYRGMVETIHLNSIPHLKEQLESDMLVPSSEMLPEDEVVW